MAATMDAGRTELFAERLLGTLNEGALCLMVSIGHRVGLFDALSRHASVTSEQLAADAGLNERYGTSSTPSARSSTRSRACTA